MQAEVTLQSYWYTFKEHCSVRRIAAINKMNVALAGLEPLRERVFMNAQTIERWLGIELDLYFDPDSSYNYKHLGEIARKLYKSTPVKESSKREILIDVVVMCIDILRIRKANADIHRIEQESTISFKEYMSYVKRYYFQVQKELIAGRGYSYGRRMGRIYIHRGRNPIGDKYKGKIDYTATRNKKNEIIAKGLRPYDKLEHEYAIKQGVEYDGIDYRVYLNNPYYYDLCWAGCILPNSSIMRLKRLKYTGKIIRKNGATMEDVARELTVEEIEISELDLMYKVNAITTKEPHLGFRYQRHNEQEIYNYRKGIRKSR